MFDGQGDSCGWEVQEQILRLWMRKLDFLIFGIRPTCVKRFRGRGPPWYHLVPFHNQGCLHARSVEMLGIFCTTYYLAETPARKHERLLDIVSILCGTYYLSWTEVSQVPVTACATHAPELG
jgi:hypothetical protein